MRLTTLRVTKHVADVTPKRIVVIGNGMVSHRFCRTLRATSGGTRHAVTVLAAEQQPAYDRIRLSTALNIPPADLLLAPQRWYEEQGIDLRLATLAKRIDRKAQRVTTEAGDSFDYDVLVLATGSEPQKPPMSGLDLPGVFMFRDLDDVAAIQLHASLAKRAAVVGGGLLGLEAAKLLTDAGLEVDLVEASDHLMSRQLDSRSAQVLRERVASLGVSVHLSERLQGIFQCDDGLVLRRGRATGDTQPTNIATDLVVVATGIRPRDSLASDAELKVGARGGIVVNDALQTNDSNIFAIGECALHDGVHYGLVAPGYEMADVLAESLCGRRRSFTGADQTCHLKVLGTPVSAVGLYDRESRHVGHASEDGGRRTLMLDGNRVIGATCVGDWYDLPRVHDAVRGRKKLSKKELSRFVDTGELWEPSAELGVASWPESTVICACTGVTRGTLTMAVGECGGDVERVAKSTGASQVCGSCKPLVAELAGARVDEVAVPGRHAVLIASAAAIVVGLLVAVAAPIPYAQSIQDPLRAIDQLWRDDLLKQISGYTLVGIAALGGLLSLRKRVRWFSLGNFGHYRALHTIVGTLSLVLLVAHTGFRFGANLNMALMSVFVGISAIGGLAGVAAGVETRLSTSIGAAARRWRGPLTHAHAALFWPLPILLGLHVFATYYY